MGALPPNPRRSAGQSPATLPSGSDMVALFKWGRCPQALLHFLREAM